VGGTVFSRLAEISRIVELDEHTHVRRRGRCTGEAEKVRYKFVCRMTYLTFLSRASTNHVGY